MAGCLGCFSFECGLKNDPFQKKLRGVKSLKQHCYEKLVSGRLLVFFFCFFWWGVGVTAGKRQYVKPKVYRANG